MVEHHNVKSRDGEQIKKLLLKWDITLYFTLDQLSNLHDATKKKLCLSLSLTRGSMMKEMESEEGREGW